MHANAYEITSQMEEPDFGEFGLPTSTERAL